VLAFFFCGAHAMRAFVRSLSIVPALLLYFAVTAAAQTQFIQLTDPHIFDADQPTQNESLDDKQKRDRITDSERAFLGAIDPINEQIDNGAGFEFIAVTGDLGTAHWSGPAEEAANRMARWIEKSKVKRFFFVPGNNDVGNSNENSDRYKGFMAALKKKLPERVVELCDTPVLENDGTLYIGFDTATFKGELPKQISDLETLREKIRSYHAKRVFIFTHIAEIDDPFRLDFNRPDPSHKDYPFSPWGVNENVRNMWHQLMADPTIKAVFTGHYHTNGHRYYQKPYDWVRGRYPKEVVEKTFLCPPISGKYQWDKDPTARGFQIVNIDREGTASARIFWYESGKFSSQKAQSAQGSH